ncbi:MAG: type II toxin-antitoxin system RelE/ParE family toxin [Patescibacteria group bacterium]|nr:type II toxin-antitoxin system RelE/ParE family toxin [Patescibacteria group bacterium]
MQAQFFRKEDGSSPVEDCVINNLQPNDQRRASEAMKRIERQNDGLQNLFKSKYARKLEEDIYEIRSNKLRILFTLKDEICWFLHVFLKKSQKTPERELNVARQRKNIIFNK